MTEKTRDLVELFSMADQGRWDWDALMWDPDDPMSDKLTYQERRGATCGISDLVILDVLEERRQVSDDDMARLMEGCKWGELFTQEQKRGMKIR